MVPHVSPRLNRNFTINPYFQAYVPRPSQTSSIWKVTWKVDILWTTSMPLLSFPSSAKSTQVPLQTSEILSTLQGPLNYWWLHKAFPNHSTGYELSLLWNLKALTFSSRFHSTNLSHLISVSLQIFYGLFRKSSVFFSLLPLANTLNSEGT